MQISAFARLTEAREKALFLASELASEAHPDRCLASIALLEAALDDPASVPRDLLAGI